MNASFTLNQNFLNSYCPEDSDFTTREEISYVEENLVNNINLKNATGAFLKEIRNNVVSYYSEANKEKFDYNKHNAMMSITAVIDNLIYRH